MLAAFQDKGDQRDGALFWQWWAGRAVRRGKWKLVCWGSKKKKKTTTKTKEPAEPAWELYDMEADRTELNDLSRKHPEIVKELAGLHEKWAAPFEKARKTKKTRKSKGRK